MSGGIFQVFRWPRFKLRRTVAYISNLFSAGEQGAWYDPSDLSSLFQDKAGTTPVTAVEQPVGRMLDKSGRGNHATQATTTKRPLLSRRVNCIGSADTRTLANATLLKSGTGLTPIITPNYAMAPDGTMTAIRVQLDCGSGLTSSNYSVVSAGFPTGYSQLGGAAYRTKIWMRATSGTASVTVTGAGAVPAEQTLTETWTLVSLSETGFANSTFALRISSNGGIPATRGAQDILVWQPQLTLATDQDLPYQWVNTNTDYDADPSKFPAYRRLDGVDDSHVSATGGGGTTGFFFSAAISPQGSAGTNRTLFSDAGTNTGYIVRLNTGNQLELSAGNGTAYTTIATSDALAVGTTDVIQAWDDGTNLNVKIGNGPTASVSRPVVVAGTASYTLGQDNGASSGYFNGRIYSEIYRKDSSLAQAQREDVAVYQRQKARIA